METFFHNLFLHKITYQLSLGLYALAMVLFTVEAIAQFVFKFKNATIRFLASGSFWAAFVIQLVWFIDRWGVAGRAPIRTRYESLILYCLCVAVVYIFIEFMYNVRVMGIVSAFSCVAIMFYSTIDRDLEITKLPPALQSGWFIPHVITYFFAYGALTIAFFCAGIYLANPSLEVSKEAGFLGGGNRALVNLNFEVMTYELIKFGFTMLTFGLVLGAVWAKFAWGDYWSWDPKENWALITWLIYFTYLHLRYGKGAKGRVAAAFAAAGYLAVMFTYLGMKYLPTAQSSLHVYQG